MNPQLIDNVSSDTKAEFKVSLHNTNYTFWKIAKPITNINFISKLYHAYLVMIGKAHAFQFFQDLSLKEQKKWVSDDIKKQVAEYVNEKKICLKCNCKKNEKSTSNNQRLLEK